MSCLRNFTAYSVSRAVSGFLIVGILFSIPTRAQVAGATLSGTITDPTGSVVMKVELAIKNVATGVTTKVTTNSDGFYIAANLLPGEYVVTISAPGFNTEERTGILLTVGAQQVFDLALHVAGASKDCLLYTSPSPRDLSTSRMPSSA